MHLYDFPVANPLTTRGPAFPDAECRPHVAVKLVVGAPFPEPALNATLIAPFPAWLAVTAFGASGDPIETPTPTEAGPTPAPVTAATVKITVAPNVNGPFKCVVVPGPTTRTAEPDEGVTR